MKYLLDTHIIIWLANNDIDKISTASMSILCAEDSKLFVSIVSFWEIALKINNGKLDLGIPLDTLYENVQKTEISVIPIQKDYILQLSSLKPIHKDPFDRLLIATAFIDSLNIITIDENIQKYDIPWTW
jgi:PIN domain nuclease of toxin-antitoxin system